MAVLATAVLCSLVAIFVVDYLLQRQVQAPQRAVLLLIAAGVIAWVWRRYAWPLLAQREGEIDMALLVERQQQIESDLVAAIQFEDDVQGRWGSRQLELAVVNYVGTVGNDIDVYKGFNQDQLRRRLTALGVAAAAVVLAAIVFPGHFAAFLNRLALGSQHYPSATRIESLAVNGRSVLNRGMQPENLRCAEGRTVEFLLRVAGTLPEQGLAHLASQQHFDRSEVDLRRLSADDRQARLAKAEQMVREAQQSPGLDLAGPWFEELESYVRVEAPQRWDALNLNADRLSATELSGQVQKKLPELQALINEVKAGDLSSDGAALYVGELPRLNEPVRYRLELGDAYTDPAEISMIALPAVEARIAATPPKYAVKALAAEATGRQAAVLPGTEVKVAIECTNHKKLKQAWVTIRPASGTQAQRFDLQPVDEAASQWRLAADQSPLRRVSEEVRYEIQVTDEDGLHLETPIKGAIRIRPDKPPVAVASTVHRVVRPLAKPSIQYRAGDDFALKRLELVVEVERLAAKSGSVAASAEGDSSETNKTPGREMAPETTRLPLLTGGPVTLERLPLAGKTAVNLASLNLDASRGPLKKGDRLKLVLVAEDERGELPGETFRSEPLIIEVSDDFGVLGAVGEADPQAAQRLDEMIKRELGIGESP